MMKNIAILGSTGSIGTQALDLCRRHPDRYRVVALTAARSKEKLFEQVREFRPEIAGLTEGFDPAEIPEDLKFCRFLSGKEAFLKQPKRAMKPLLPHSILLVPPERRPVSVFYFIK